jgi:hypothetical protein
MANGELTNVVNTPQDDLLFRSNVSKMTGYMRFLGILYIIGGALYCITIIGALVGVPVIFLGNRMREAADNFDKYSLSGVFQDLSVAIEKQTRFFFIQYVLAIIGLIFLVIYIFVIIAVVASKS